MRENKSLKNINEYLDQVEYIKEKVSFLKKEIPDIQVKISNYEIQFCPFLASKSINQDYTALDFNSSRKSLTVTPYRIVKFTYKGKGEDIKIYSDPSTSRLIYITKKYDKLSNSVITYLNFSKMVVNFQNNNFNGKMLNDCRLQILEFMKKHPKHKLNTKHMDPKLKNLMVFN